MTQSSIKTDGADQALQCDSISRNVVEAVADAEGVEASELAIPLFDAIDPDALDAFFQSTVDKTGASIKQLVFRYHGYEVTVTGTGNVTVEQ